MRKSVSLVTLALCAVTFGCSQAPLDVGTSASARSTAEARACTTHAWTIVSRTAEARTETVLSLLGSTATQYEATPSGEVAVRTVITRDRDGLVVGIDPRTHAVQTTTVQEAVRARLAERAHIATATMPDLGITPGAPPPPLVEAVSGVTHLGGRPGRAYTFRDRLPGGRRMRVTYANGLPRPPLATRRLIASLQVFDSPLGTPDGGPGEDGPDIAIADRIAGRAVLRIEVEEAGAWMTTLDTESITRAEVPCDLFDPPASASVAPTGAPSGGSPGAAPPPPPPAPTPTTCPGAEPAEISATVHTAGGSLVKDARVYLFFWGRTFNDPAHQATVDRVVTSFGDYFAPRYIDPLHRSYGMNGGRVERSRVVDENPPGEAGNAGSLTVLNGFVLGRSSRRQGPSIWWALGGNDPIYAVLVAENDVLSEAWTGYHFMVFNLAVSLIPFPFTYFVHEGMPFFLVKVPGNAFSPDPATFESGIDETTERISHELVETMTDAMPFTGYTDPSKVPVWEQGEISDICSGSAGRRTARTRVGTTVVSTYWSESDGACMPESRPSLAILNPLDHQTFPLTSGGVTTTLLATVSDASQPVGLGADVAWSIDGHDIPVRGLSVASNPMGLGGHLIEASIRNRFGGTARACVTVQVTGEPPTAFITAPVDGAALTRGAPVALRGDGFDIVDLPLPESAFAWSIGAAQLGLGRQVIWTPTTEGTFSITLTVTNSLGLSATQSRGVTVASPTGAPRVVITSPANDTYFSAGNGPIRFTATATDGSGAAIPDASISWASDYDGPLGVGAVLDRALREGATAPIDHRITVTVTDGAGRSASDSILIHVGSVG